MMESKPQIEILPPNVPLKSASNLYWDALCKNAILAYLGRFLPNVMFTPGSPFKAVFAMSHGGQDDICAEAKDFTSTEVRVSRKELKAFVEAIDNFHKKAGEPGVQDWVGVLAKDFKIPDPRFMPAAWRVSAKSKRLIVLWGYHSGNEKDVILPLTPTSAKWDDAAKRIDIVELLDEEKRIRVAPFAMFARVAAAVAMVLAILSGISWHTWRTSPELREKIFWKMAVFRGEACAKHFGTSLVNGVCPECKAEEEKLAAEAAAEAERKRIAAEREKAKLPGYRFDEEMGYAVWMPGMSHPDFPHVKTSDMEGQWRPESGWEWTDGGNSQDERGHDELCEVRNIAERQRREEEEARRKAEEAAIKALEEAVAKALAAFRKGDFDSGYALAMKIQEDKIADAELLFFIGDCFESGKGGAEKDGKTMLKWYRRSAEAGSAEGQYRLGFHLRHPRGDILPLKNEAEARVWFEKAAAQGHKKAKRELNRKFTSIPFTHE